MSRFERKIKRQKLKRDKKHLKETEKDMEEKMGLFGSLGDHCEICSKAFDKNNKKMVQSWYVIVREQQGKVNLYCPPCWDKALQQIQDIQKIMTEAPSDN